MRVETILGIMLVIISIGNYILYTELQNKITKLENSLVCSEASAILYENRLNKTAVKCVKLENEVKKLKSESCKIKGV